MMRVGIAKLIMPRMHQCVRQQRAVVVTERQQVFGAKNAQQQDLE